MGQICPSSGLADFGSHVPYDVQDLAVVVLLMLIPLLAPAETGTHSAGFSRIAQALGLAAVKVTPPLFASNTAPQGPYTSQNCAFTNLLYEILESVQACEKLRCFLSLAGQ